MFPSKGLETRMLSKCFTSRVPVSYCGMMLILDFQLNCS